MTKAPQLQIQRRSIVRWAQVFTSEAYLSLLVFLYPWLCNLPALSASFSLAVPVVLEELSLSLS
jgi:predicted YcjX-like family ATPase